jgi:hypothetical protein
VPLLPLSEAPEGDSPRGGTDREAGYPKVAQGKLNGIRGKSLDYEHDHENKQETL